MFFFLQKVTVLTGAYTVSHGNKGDVSRHIHPSGANVPVASGRCPEGNISRSFNLTLFTCFPDTPTTCHWSGPTERLRIRAAYASHGTMSNIYLFLDRRNAPLPAHIQYQQLRATSHCIHVRYYRRGDFLERYRCWWNDCASAANRWREEPH